MNQLSLDRRAAVIRALVDGASIRAACRMTGVAKGTVLKLLAEIGESCLAYQRRALVDLPCVRVQCDEIWSFVGAKEKNTPEELRGTGERGDCWTWTAICADTKLIPCWHVGPRDASAALIFMEGLVSRLANRVQLTTDGHKAYLSAVESAFGWNGVDYAMLVKLYGNTTSTDSTRRYSPAECIGAEVTPIMGTPAEKHVSTSYAERANLTIRMSTRRFTRLTNGYSKKMRNHLWAISLHFMYYNFCRPHHTLTKANGGIHKTPAMAAGVTDHVWKVEEIIGLLSSNRE